MQLLKWEDRFSVGVREFDQHHRILFEMINSLFIAKDAQSSLSVIQKTLEQLHMYTIFHFAAEEAMMEYFHYEGLDQHVAEHKDLLEQVQAYETRIKSPQGISLDELLEFVAAWWLDHTQGLDQLYGPFLRHRVN